MTDKDRDEALLEDAFAALREEMKTAAAPEADAALIARVLADAEGIAAQGRGRAPARRHRRAGAASVLRAMLRALGGWPSLAGLAAAAIAGLWIGIDPPEVLAQAVQNLWAVEAGYLIDIDPAAAFEIAEEAS